jgi:hypothetical protein
MNDLNAALGGSMVSFADFDRHVASLRQGITEGKLSSYIVEGGFEHLLRGHALRREFPIWKTLTFDLKHDTLTTIDTAYFKKMRELGIKINPNLSKIIFGCGFPPQGETEIDVVLVTPRQLGFNSSEKRSRAIARARELGLELCPPLTALALRLAYTAEEQPCGEWIEVVSEPIIEYILRLGHPDPQFGTYLDSMIWKTTATNAWLPDQKLVFNKPRLAD